MTDREKVLHGLSSCGTDHGIPNICEVTECPYREDKAWCVHGLAHDAGILIAELLKAQEPGMVNVTIAQSDGWKEGNCPFCGMKVDSFYNWSFCGTCGKGLKWE